MIPADLASTLKTVIPDPKVAGQAQQTQPVTPAARITDVLSNLVPGQRVLAEIQALLPNGTYRALVGQREVTLALPFSAKAGDSLELEVAESDGKLTLAFVANRGEPSTTAKDQSVPTSLSSTGKLIGELMKGIDGEGKRAPPTPLNGNQALLSSSPKSGAEFAPILKQALSQSGMFYEAHQARWVAGQLPTEQLRQEPQGRQPTETSGQANNPAPSSTSSLAARDGNIAQPQQPGGIPRDIAPLVQQQLDGLANQNFAWQGQIWPGQKLWWEIGENTEDPQSGDGETAARWRTRLKLHLPLLGEIDAQLQLDSGGELGIRILSGSDEGESRLRNAIPELHEQLQTAGLTVRQILIDHETDQTE